LREEIGMRKVFYMILLELVLVGGVACNENDCSMTNVALARFDFLSGTGKSVTTTSEITVTGFITTETGETKTDTLFNKSTSTFSLPLSYTKATTYVLHHSDAIRDTIWLTHDNIPYVADIDCGFMMFYQITSVRHTTNALDSIKLVNPKVTNEEKKNFNIYFTVAE